MALKYADNVGSQLFDPISQTDTFAVVEAVTSFPANISPTDFAVATIANDDNSLTESIKITFIDRPTRALTIERGYDSSTPRDWPKGSKIEIRISSGFFRAFEEQVNTYADDAVSVLAAASNTTTEAKSKAAFAVAFVLS